MSQSTILVLALAALANSGSGGGSSIGGTVSVAVAGTNTVSPETSANVINSGTETNVVLTFDIPRGSKWFVINETTSNGGVIPDGSENGDYILDAEGKVCKVSNGVLQDLGVTVAGKSAYKYAQEGGYTGTEQDFIEAISNISEGIVGDYLSTSGGEVVAGPNYLKITERGIEIGNSNINPKFININSTELLIDGPARLQNISVDLGEVTG